MVKYGLLSKFYIDNTNTDCNKNLNRYRDVLGMKSVKDMPKTF